MYNTDLQYALHRDISSGPSIGWGQFLIGALIGAGIALLYAPKSGREMREQLVTKGKDITSKVDQGLEKAGSFIRDKKSQ